MSPNPSSLPPAESNKRRRGAQPGNQNARKHGLTPRPKPPEYRAQKLTHVDLTAEIHILRQQIQRLNEASLQASTLAETIEISRVIAQTASALARLIRAQVIVFSADSSESTFMEEWEAGVTEALHDVYEELFHPDPPSSPSTAGSGIGDSPPFREGLGVGDSPPFREGLGVGDSPPFRACPEAQGEGSGVGSDGPVEGDAWERFRTLMDQYPGDPSPRKKRH